MSRSFKPLVLVLILIGLALGAWLNSEPQGKANANCDRFPGPSVPNSTGMTVSSHTTACTTLGTSVVSYVYVHPSGTLPQAGDLVFRYSQGTSGGSLEVQWIDDRHVVLAVDQVTHVSKIRTSAGAIAIEYKLSGV